jgi:hypothetical protein
MHEYGSLPRARRDGLLEEAAGEELLLYDQESHTAHCLSPAAASVWSLCDGEHDTTELATLTGLSASLVADALHELREKDLLVAQPQLTQSTVPGESRREAMVRVGRYGAAAVGGAMVVSAMAATPAMAASEHTCCQCYEKPELKGPCTCSEAPRTIVNNEACNTYCTEHLGPACSSEKGSGLLKGGMVCGAQGVCRNP